MDPKKVLITGGTGRLGPDVVAAFKGVLSPSKSEFDITNREKVFAYVEKHKPIMVIHMAALVPIRECEDNKPLAWQTNVEGTKNLVDALETHCPECYLVYISSPCIFSGIEGECTEESLPNPKNFYGLTKVVAETVVLRAKLARTLVVRTNFVPKLKWPYEGAFTDRFSTYLFADDVAKALVEVTSKGVTGILHITGDRKMSMYDLAVMTTPAVKPITLANYTGPDLTKDMSMKTIHNEWAKFKISTPSRLFI